MISYSKALRLDATATDDRSEVAKEFAILTGTSEIESRLLLDWTIDSDTAIKMNRGVTVQIDEPESSASEEARKMMSWLSHRLRIPGRQRGTRLEGALESIRKDAGDRELKRLIDYGGGGGNDSIFYGKNGYEVSCADFPSKWDAYVKKRFEIHGSHCELIDVRSLEFSQQYDVLTSMDVLEHIYDVEDSLAKMLSLVRVGGYLAIEEDFFNVLYDTEHIEKNRFYHRRVPDYFKRYTVRLRAPKEVYVFRKTFDTTDSFAELSRAMYLRTRRRAMGVLLLNYPLVLFAPLESAAWKAARLFLGPASKLAAKRKDMDVSTARSILTNRLHKYENYLAVDRFSDAWCCFRVAGDRLRKLNR